MIPADLDPLEATERYLIPRGAVEASELVLKEGYVCRWADGKWEYVEDHRDKTVYDKKTGEQLSHNELGPLPDKVTTMPPLPYSEWSDSEKAWVEVENAMNYGWLMGARRLER